MLIKMNETTTGLIIFARYDSRRIPGKALLPICGRSLLGHVVDRARRVRAAHRLVMATTERRTDDGIAAFAEQEEIDLFRGSLANVALRAYRCAEKFGLVRFARICGDRPFLDPELIETLLDKHTGDNADLATNAVQKTFPKGLDTEIVSTEALGKALPNMRNAGQREHITRYFYEHADDFRVLSIEAPRDLYAGVNLAVDTHQDVRRTEWIMERLAPPPATASLDEVVMLARAWSNEPDVA